LVAVRANSVGFAEIQLQTGKIVIKRISLAQMEIGAVRAEIVLHCKMIIFMGILWDRIRRSEQ
jgi:hypothetical protein